MPMPFPITYLHTCVSQFFSFYSSISINEHLREKMRLSDYKFFFSVSLDFAWTNHCS